MIALTLLLIAAQGKVEPPRAFETDARKWVKEADPIPLDARLKRRFEVLASMGRVADLVRDDARWLPYIIDGFLSDDEKIARSSLQAMRDICDKLRISAESGKNPVDLDLFKSAQWRAGTHTMWAGWWSKNMDLLSPRDTDVAARKAASAADWDGILKALRPGGGYDDSSRPEGQAFARVKGMGPAAWPYLVKHLDHEDIMVGRAAATALLKLTGFSHGLPTEADKGRIRGEWMKWLAGRGRDPVVPPSLAVVLMMTSSRTDEEAAKLIEALSSDDVARREAAAAELARCALPHAARIRKALAESRDAESRSALEGLVKWMPAWEEEEIDVRLNPELLLDFLKALPRDTPDYEAVWARTGKLYRTLSGK